MYFYTPASPNKFLIGIHDNYVYAYGGKEDGTIWIFRKCVIDANEWIEVYDTKIIPSISKCECHSGMPIAATLVGTTILITGICNKSCFNGIVTLRRFFTFSFNLQTFHAEPFIQRGDPLLEWEKICNHCSKYYITAYFSDDEKHGFKIVPNQMSPTAVKESEIVYFDILNYVTTKQFVIESIKIRIGGKARSNFGFTKSSQLIYVSQKEHGMIQEMQIKTKFGGYGLIPNIKDAKWMDIGFFQNDNNETLMMNRIRIINGKEKMCVKKIAFNEDTQLFTSDFEFIFHIDDFPALKKSQIFFAPNILIVSSPVGFITVVNRALSLSESAYISLLRASLPSRIPYDYINHLMKTQKNYKQERVISVKDIRKALNLPPWSLQLKHL